MLPADLPREWQPEARLGPHMPNSRVRNRAGAKQGVHSLYDGLLFPLEPSAATGRHRTQWASVQLATRALSTGHNSPLLLTSLPPSREVCCSLTECSVTGPIWDGTFSSP